ncbi:MAG: FecR domain-containing protein [Bacteroidales bacterium]|nr:FecR domain-containing protein [Bacteroidales bacterium]
MNTNDTYYTDLITRYLSGEALPEEISELSSWIGSNPEHATLFSEFRKTWESITADQVEQQLDPSKEWEVLLPKLKGIGAQGTGPGAQGQGHRAQGTGPKQEGSGHRAQGSGLRAKAPGQKAPDIESWDPASGIRHLASEKEPKVIQMESNRLPWQVVMIRASLIAAIALVLLIPAWMTYHYFSATDMVRLTASGEVLEAVLPDGTTISLNAYASISYPENYGINNREVILNGQGYFEVNRDSLLPFVITCGSSKLEVLGTSFFVDAEQAAGNMEVVLVDGSVAVYFEDARSTGKTIIPGEKAKLIQTDQRIIISPNEDPNFMAWKTHNLIFLDDRLDMILTTLNKIYQSNITLANENLADCRLTATFSQQSLESVLSVIGVTLDLQSETTPSGIILYGKGCN